jgi:hypothetical protein
MPDFDRSDRLSNQGETVIHSIPGRRLAALAAAALLGLGLTALGASPASAAGVGYVRLAHLSPDTPDVDVYLKPVSGNTQAQKFPGVGYGTVSKYLPLPVGSYEVAMRAAKADPSTPALLTTQVNVAEGKAYTVAGVGPKAGLGLKVIDDDLGLPPAGQAKVRVIQASMKQPLLNITCAGKSIGDGVKFASTTDYRDVAPGKWTIKLAQPGSTKTTTVSAPLQAGAVYSLIVLDRGGSGGLTAQLRTDAKSNGVPEGGVATGAGGTAKRGNPLGLLSIGAGLLLLIVAGGGFLLRRARLGVQPR